MREQYDRYPYLEGFSNQEKMLEYSRAYRQRNPEKILYRAARDRAKKRNLEFNIDLDDVIIPEVCPILGIPIISEAGRGTRGGKMNSPSIDRINNDLGYVKGNIQVISHKANSMKFTASPEELLQFAEWIRRIYG